jgi:hypothetical protein
LATGSLRAYLDYMPAAPAAAAVQKRSPLEFPGVGDDKAFEQAVRG